jgi:hypothetical protein
VTRREFGEWLADKTGLPVAMTPLDPVMAPGYALEPGTNYRQALVACAWTAGVGVRLVVGTMAETGNVYDLCDDMVDDTLTALEAGNVAVDSVAAPVVDTIGDTAYLTVTIQAMLP